MKNQISDFAIFIFWSYCRFCTQKDPNFRWIFTHNSKNKNWEKILFRFSFYSAHSASFIKIWPPLEGGVCISFLGTWPKINVSELETEFQKLKGKKLNFNFILFFILFITFRIFHKNLTTSEGGKTKLSSFLYFWQEQEWKKEQDCHYVKWTKRPSILRNGLILVEDAHSVKLNEKSTSCLLFFELQLIVFIIFKCLDFFRVIYSWKFTKPKKKLVSKWPDLQKRCGLLWIFFWGTYSFWDLVDFILKIKIFVMLGGSAPRTWSSSLQVPILIDGQNRDKKNLTQKMEIAW